MVDLGASCSPKSSLLSLESVFDPHLFQRLTLGTDFPSSPSAPRCVPCPPSESVRTSLGISSHLLPKVPWFFRAKPLVSRPIEPTTFASHRSLATVVAQIYGSFLLAVTHGAAARSWSCHGVLLCVVSLLCCRSLRRHLLCCRVLLCVVSSQLHCRL